MNVAAVRGRVFAANLAVYGVPVTVRVPNAAPATTRWNADAKKEADAAALAPRERQHAHRERAELQM